MGLEFIEPSKYCQLPSLFFQKYGYIKGAEEEVQSLKEEIQSLKSSPAKETQDQKPAIWAEQCLQKLVNVRKNECLRQGREVKFSEVAKILGIKQKVVDGLLSICSHTESLYLEDIKGGGVKSDYYDNGLEEDCRAEVDTNAKDDWLQQNAEKICSRKELDVLAHRLMEPKLYLVSITSTTEEFPVVDNRIKEIENLISQNKYDERLVDMLKDFFGFEPRSTQEPDVDLLIRLGIYNN